MQRETERKAEEKVKQIESTGESISKKAKDTADAADKASEEKIAKIK